MTRFGPLFSLYIAFVVGFLFAAIWTALRAMREADEHLRHQLSIIALGIAFSSSVAITTNLILPYAYGVFVFQEIGALSILVFIASCAYAISVHRLFDVRIVIRKTLVIALLIGSVEKVYGGMIGFLVETIPGAKESAVLHEVISLATVLFIAWSFRPVKRWLERQIDGLLYRSTARRDRSQKH